MSKTEILKAFKDIDFMYNDSSKLDTLARCLDEFKNEIIDEVISKCSKEYQAFSDDTVCKIWLSELEKLKEIR